MGKNYLLLGPEAGEKADFIEGIRASLNPDTESYKIYPYDDYARSLTDALGNASLFCPERFVWLDIPKEYTDASGGMLKAELEKLVCQYLAHPDSDVTFVLTSAETRINRPIDAFFGKDAPEGFEKRVFWEMKEAQKPGWVRTFMRKNGVSIQEEALNLILMLVENDTSELRTICSQLAIFTRLNGSDCVTQDDVESFLSHTRQEDGYTLFAYMARRDLEGALRCIDAINASASTDQFSRLFPALVWSFRRLHSVLVQIQQGTDQSSAFAGASVFERGAKISRPNDITIYRSACANYRLTDVEAILAVLSDTEAELRQGGADLTRIILHRMIWTIVGNRGRRPDCPQFPRF